MNITLSLDERLVKEVRKIAVERDTTLTGLVREYLEKLAAESATTTPTITASRASRVSRAATCKEPWQENM